MVAYFAQRAHHVIEVGVEHRIEAQDLVFVSIIVIDQRPIVGNVCLCD